MDVSPGAAMGLETAESCMAEGGEKLDLNDVGVKPTVSGALGKANRDDENDNSSQWNAGVKQNPSDTLVKQTAKKNMRDKDYSAHFFFPSPAGNIRNSISEELEAMKKRGISKGSLIENEPSAGEPEHAILFPSSGQQNQTLSSTDSARSQPPTTEGEQVAPVGLCRRFWNLLRAQRLSLIIALPIPCACLIAIYFGYVRVAPT